MSKLNKERLDQMIARRTENQALFLSLINKEHFQTKFLTDGSSNYAFNLILRNPDKKLFSRLEKNLRKAGIEYRKGSAGGGNQMRQPYVREVFKFTEKEIKKIAPVTDHIHFFGMYLGNYPELDSDSIREIVRVISG